MTIKGVELLYNKGTNEREQILGTITVDTNKLESTDEMVIGTDERNITMDERVTGLDNGEYLYGCVQYDGGSGIEFITPIENKEPVKKLMETKEMSKTVAKALELLIGDNANTLVAWY